MMYLEGVPIAADPVFDDLDRDMVRSGVGYAISPEIAARLCSQGWRQIAHNGWNEMVPPAKVLHDRRGRVRGWQGIDGKVDKR